jgi:hypothetical protein
MYITSRVLNIRNVSATSVQTWNGFISTIWDGDRPWQEEPQEIGLVVEPRPKATLFLQFDYYCSMSDMELTNESMR